ncbi:MAG: PAS domain S-box protein [Candidatus Saganbacteria bacterium]|nr:PAS domain S-box protein [Candidatus Saganbacteria bacterium]
MYKHKRKKRNNYERSVKRTKGLKAKLQGMISSKVRYVRAGEIVIEERDLANKYLEVMGGILLVFDKKGRIVFINKSGARLLGWSRAKLIGMNWFDHFLFKPERKILWTGFQKLMKGDVKDIEKAFMRGSENRIRAKNGREFFVIWRNTLLKDAKGRNIGTISAGQDITQRKKLEEEKESLLYDLRERAKELFCLQEMGRIVELPGISLGRILQQLPGIISAAFRWPELTCVRIELDRRQFMSPNYKKTKWSIFKGIKVKGKKVGCIEVCCLKTKGKSKDRLLLKEEVALIGLISERLGGIVERMQAEEEIHLAHTFNETLLRTMPFAMDIVGENGNIVYLNKSMEDIVGKRSVGRKCWEIYKDNKIQCGNCPLIKGINLNQTANIEVGGCLGGKTFEIFYTGMLFRGKKAVLEVFVDITERKKSEEVIIGKNKELEELYKIKSEFTSMVSHELRTPLTAIKEGIGIVADGTAGKVNEDQKNFLELAKRNVDRLHRLINDVLDFSKLEANKMKLDLRFENIAETIVSAADMEKKSIESKGLYLKTDLASNLPKIKFDSDRITQVLINFLSNAQKFTQKGGITLSLTKNEKEKSVVICVADTGHGIAKKDIPDLFKKFHQLGGLGNRQTGGTGLGLAICKEIIVQHKGKFWVESKLGSGSKFYFSLPIKEN